jgi:hypothetical protein
MSPLWWIIIAAYVMVTMALGALPGIAETRRQEARRLRQLRAMSEDQLVRRILDCDYFDLRETTVLREEPLVQAFLERVAARDHGALYRTFFGETGELGVPIFFLDAERAIGFQGRPMILDYYAEFAEIARELHSRAPSPAP